MHIDPSALVDAYKSFECEYHVSFDTIWLYSVTSSSYSVCHSISPFVINLFFNLVMINKFIQVKLFANV